MPASPAALPAPAGRAADPGPVAASARWWLGGIVLTGLALRVGWAVYAARPPVGLHDPSFYTVFAEQLAAGNGYRLPDGQPTAYYPVGYPALLAAAFWLADATPLPGDRTALVVAVNLVAAAASMVLLFEVGRRLFDHRVGLASAAGLAVMPNLVFHTSLALTETVFNAIALGAVLVVVALRWDRPSVPSLAAFGALTGVAALVRPPSLLFLPLLALAGWRAAGWGWRPSLRALAVPSLAAAAVILPWTVRNVVVMDAPILISTNVGDNLCIGNNPEATGAFSMPPSCLAGYDHLRRPAYEVRRDADGRRKALEHVTSDPADQLRLVPLRAYHTFRGDTDGLDATESYGDDPFLGSWLRTVLGAAANATFFATLVLGVAALALRRGDHHPGRTFTVLAAASLAATPLAFFGDVRFHVPVVPFLVLGAAAVAVPAAARVRRRPG